MKTHRCFIIAFLCCLLFLPSLIALPIEAKTTQEGADSESYPPSSDYANSRIAVLTGSNFPELVEASFPEAEQIFYNTVADMIQAMQSGKVDAIAIDEPVGRNIMAENDWITMADGYLASFDFAFFFAKTEEGEALANEVSAFLRKVKEDGTMDALQKKWFDSVPDESMMSIDPNTLSAPNGELAVSVMQYPPFVIRGEHMYCGYEVELLTMFAQEKGLGLSFVSTNADGTLPEVQSGRCDVAATGAAITEERKEVIVFSEPDYSGGVVLIVRDERGGSSTSFISRLKESFEKTFIRENRYLLFLHGIWETVLLTVLSALFGTGLGFLIFMACRKGNPVANLLARFFSWLIAGMPAVVLLMILYYIVFGKTPISGMAVSVIAFTLVFGAEVYGKLKTAVGAIDRGQTEAGYALGFTDRQTFFKFILPQALPHLMPSYRGGLVSLIKATAVVGFVAVEDLTKTGDIIRSRTYEAFFPLIAVAVIYYILAAILVFLVDRFTMRMDPARRDEKEILKGVQIHD
ncbi:MAG: transporter substrate-binding domain-containing protein [Lachnospiraceae bacterium]|nr:transporter substrate-binding domain-containing protein [Lachnospiraceae bacterium]MBP3737410.1 transporter substrate-binding domain-containing protein [Lachnospiraceae bacterium]